MGGTTSKSSATLSNNTVVVNQSTLNSLNTTTNTTAVNSLISNVQQCSASIVQNQTLTIKGVSCGDNCNISLFQNQSAWLDFKCAQQASVQNSVMQQMSTSLNSQLASGMSTNLLNTINSALSAKSQQDWGTFPWSSSTATTAVQQEINNYVSSKTNTNITDAVNNSVYANFKTSNFNNCIASIINSQEITAENITAGTSFTFTINQSQTAQNVTNCIQSINIANGVVSDIAKLAGLALQINNDTGVSNESATTAQSEATNSGILQGVASVVQSITAGLGDLLSGLGLAVLIPFMIPSSGCLFFCCSCMCCIVMMMLMGGGFGGSSGADLDTAT